MATGVSSIFYPEQPTPPYDLVLNDCYYLIRLHDAQAFFQAGWLVRPGFLIFSSLLESSFQPGLTTQSLYQLTTLRKNTPCHLGLSINFTDWLPARPTDTLKITLKYTVVQDTPFKELVDQVEQMGLVAKLSLVKPDWAVAVKISGIVGRLLSYLLREGSQREIFPLPAELNLASLKTGYYAIVGSYTDEGWPKELRVDVNGRLTDANNHLLLRHSYAVLEVLALPRRGEEIARDEPWWELLQAGKERALNSLPADDQERRQVMEDWQRILAQVRTLTRKQRGYLLREIEDMLRTAQIEVEGALFPRTAVEASGLGELPTTWQDLLAVHTRQELVQSVKNYQDALALSSHLVKQYDLIGS